MKLWGGRFETGPSEVFERFSGSLHFDRRLLDADMRGSQAFARALERVGHSDRGGTRGRSSPRSTRSAPRRASPAFFEGATDEDVHTLRHPQAEGARRRAGRQDPHRPQPQRAGFARYAAVAARGVRPLRAICCATLMAALLDLAAQISRRRHSRLHAHAARAGGAVAALPAGLFRNVRARLRTLRRSARAAPT